MDGNVNPLYLSDHRASDAAVAAQPAPASAETDAEQVRLSELDLFATHSRTAAHPLPQWVANSGAWLLGIKVGHGESHP